MKKKVLSISLILVILLSLCPDVRAHADTGVAFYLKHKHTGTQDVCEGCYTSPHYHVHTDEDGDCYAPIYHTHTGSRSGGGCYTVPVLHQHSGSSTSGGGCYVPKYHTHTDSCYTTRICHFTRRLENTGLTPSWCHVHGDITQVEADLIESHPSCGMGTLTGGVSYCPSCGYTGSIGGWDHEYSELTCPKNSSTIDGYVLGCGRSAGSVDHYEIGCGLEGVIEGYELVCTKTDTDIDFYDLGCGMEDGDNAVAVKVTQSPVSGGMQLTASLDDKSGGFIDISGADFKWTDADGNELGMGGSLRVSSNGTYGLEVIISDEAIYEDSCSGSVDVTGIRPPGSDNGNDSDGGNDSNTDDDGSYTDDQGTTDDGGNGDNWQDDVSGDEDDTYDDLPEATATPSATPTATPVVSANSGSGNGTDSRMTESGSNWKNDADTGSEGDGSDALLIGSAVPTAGIGKNITIEKKKVDATKTDAGNDEDLQNGTMTGDDKGRNNGFLGKAGQFLRTPAGKVITIGVSTALLLGALFLLLLLLRNTIIVFNFDGHMKKHFVGITFIRLKKDGYELEIPDEICERAYTNRYEFFMGLFMIGRDPDTEILVIKKDRQTMAKLERMMRVTI